MTVHIQQWRKNYYLVDFHILFSKYLNYRPVFMHKKYFWNLLNINPVLANKQTKMFFNYRYFNGYDTIWV